MTKTILACEDVAPVGEYTFDTDFSHCILCPWCKYVHYKEDDAEGEYQYSDYVSTTEFLKGMLWCFHCDSSFVIDDYTEAKVLSREEARIAYPDLFKNDISSFKYFYEVTFAKIIEVVDNSLTNYESPVKLTRSQIAEILAAGDTRKGNHNDILENVLEKYSITEGHVDDSRKFNLALECGTDNVFHPKVPYPKGMELDHGGCYIYLWCFSETTGKYYEYAMWGD